MTIATVSYAGKTVVAEPLTPEGFAKYGSVISPDHQVLGAPTKGAGNVFTEPDIVKPVGFYSQSKFETKSHCSFNLQRFLPPAGLDREAKKYTMTVIERHPLSTQTFFPMGVDEKEAAYLVVATENDSGEWLSNFLFLHLLCK